MTHLLLAGILLAAQGAQCPADTKSILPLVAEAIEDELYDLGRQGDYFHIDGTSGSELPAGISMFVDKNLSRNCTGVVIYKNMPVGEVYRYFTVTHGVVILSDDPESKFPPIGGSMLTVYMPMREVAEFISAKAYEYKFSIDPKASLERLTQSSRRQRQRTGYSYRLGK